MNPLDVVQDLIRPTEEVKVAIEARSPPRTDTESDTWSSASAADVPVVHRRKILAVVSHLNADGKLEHGCVFVLSEKPPRVHAIPGEFVVEHAFPVVGGFAIAMSQPRGPGDLSPPPPGAASKPRTELTVTINPGQDSPFQPVALQTGDIPGLRKILDECKRLREEFAAETEDDYDFEPFAWVGPYIADNVLPPLLSPIPPDLREIKKPVHTRLSRASAGAPGNDITDIELVREAWMRGRVERELYAQSEKAGLTIRIGTFNVNGKLPSQDLSAWVRAQVARPAGPFIPPLKEISPLSLGEVQKDPVEERMEKLALDDTVQRPEDPATGAGSSTAASATLVSTPSAAGSTFDFATSATEADDVVEDPDDPDMLVLGFQELDLSTEALLYSTKTIREDAWCMAVFAGLGEKAVLYEKLVSKQLVGMLIVIVVKRRLAPQFSEIRTSSVGTGIMGLMGNKGATAVRLLFTPTPSAATNAGAEQEGKPATLTFVNAHLAAFDEMFEKRNADFHDLSKRLQFDSGIPADDSAASGPATVQLSIFETDALFWLGDLNYRLTASDADVRTLLASDDLRAENITLLRRYDQLAIAMRERKAFEEFVEFPITHLPSYRFSAGVLTDSLGYDMKRKPAWTDRILHIASPAATVKQSTYASHPTITMSDHRPVSANFNVEVPAVSSLEYETFVERIWRSVSGVEYMEERPRVRVSPTSIDFAKLRHKVRVTRNVAVENIGKVPCSFRFVAQTAAADPCPGWLRLDTMTGLVLPGEKVEIGLAAYIDDALASQLNMGETRLEETLVIHTALGRDHFVAIAGEYGTVESPPPPTPPPALVTCLLMATIERTCFATSMAWLVRLPGPVRELKSQTDLLPEDRGVNAPRELMRLVNWLMGNSTVVDGLFLARGDESLVRQIRESLDTGAEFPVDGLDNDPAAALAFADVLLQFLDSLVEPVIPPALHPRCAEVTSRDEAFEVLDGMPVVNVNVWISLTAFLHFIGQQEAYKGNVERLVAIFTPVLFRDDLGSSVPVSAVGKRNFLRYFIG